MTKSILVKRSFLKPWKKIYIKDRFVDGYTITYNKDEAKVFEDLTPFMMMAIEDDLFFTRFKFQVI